MRIVLEAGDRLQRASAPRSVPAQGLLDLLLAGLALGLARLAVRAGLALQGRDDQRVARRVVLDAQLGFAGGVHGTGAAANRGASACYALPARPGAPPTMAVFPTKYQLRWRRSGGRTPHPMQVSASIFKAYDIR